jgi:peptidyl-prolyl cis-trans isomerase C
LAHRSILSQAAMQDFIMNTPVSDAEIQKEYDATFGGAGQEEYKARHILTKTEDEAKQVIQKLKAGGDFKALAKEYSTDPTAGPSGGDLGWFSAQQMVAPFSSAVVAMKNGDYSQEPVQTQFGWHVILREESRAKTPPPLEAVKANIQAQMQRNAIENHIETLRTSAKIEMTPPKSAEETAAPSEPTPQANDSSPAAEKTPAVPEGSGEATQPAATESK